MNEVPELLRDKPLLSITWNDEDGQSTGLEWAHLHPKTIALHAMDHPEVEIVEGESSIIACLLTTISIHQHRLTSSLKPIVDAYGDWSYEKLTFREALRKLGIAT